MATSALPSRGPIGGQNCYVTSKLSGVSNAKCEEKIRSGYLTPTFLGAQTTAELLRNTYILGGLEYQARRHNGKLLPQWCLLGCPKEGGNATATRNSWRPPTQRVVTKLEVATSPLPCRGPIGRQNGYATPPFPGVPNTTRGKKIRTGSLTPAVSGARKRITVPCNPCILGGPPTPRAGTKSEVAT